MSESSTNENHAADIQERSVPPSAPPLALWMSSSEWPPLLPHFSSETVASRIPVELWDLILSHLRHEPETLSIVEEVCKGWYKRSCRLREHGEDEAISRYFNDKEDVRLCAQYMWKMPRNRRRIRHVTLRGSLLAERGKVKQSSLAHLGAFTVAFAGKQLPRLYWLRIEDGEWIRGTIPDSVFVQLSTFHLITDLELYGITLPSSTVLLRLVCALDSLKHLAIRKLVLSDVRLPPAGRRWTPSPNLKSLVLSHMLNWADEFRELCPSTNITMSSGHAAVSLLLEAISHSSLQQPLQNAGKDLIVLSLDLLPPLQHREPQRIQFLCVLNMDLSRNIGLRHLSLHLNLDNLHGEMLQVERAETYDVFRRIISSASPTVLEHIDISLTCSHSPNSPSVLSRALLPLCTWIYPLDHLLVQEGYTSLESVHLHLRSMDEESKRTMKSEWADLGPVWFPNLYSRGIIRCNVG